MLLGAVIEAVSRHFCYDLVKQAIFPHAGKRSTDSRTVSVVVPDRAISYAMIDGRWTNRTDSLGWRGIDVPGR
jgi:hypothetical protein